MSDSERSQFKSKLGFVLAAAGSAVGVGNIWGFPSKAADNGGGAFLLVYLILIFLLGYPMLLAEMAIGRYGQSHPIGTLSKVTPSKIGKTAAFFIGGAAIVTVTGIYSFYSIVSGWFVAFTTSPIFSAIGCDTTAAWISSQKVMPNVLFTLIFAGMTLFVVIQGVEHGIEKWSRRLMPMMFAFMIILTIFMIFQDGAMVGLKRYLVPDFSKVFNWNLIISALGQTAFSLSLGSGAMMVYGSYLNRNENLPRLAMQVTLLDTGVAFLAGLLIVPAMYVAQNLGVEILDNGKLVESGKLVFDVLPTLFSKLGILQYPVGIIFFALMTVAALTSSISMMETPAAFLSEHFGINRRLSAIISTSIATFLSLIIVLNFEKLFGTVITLSTEYAQPLVSLAVTIYAGWLWKRNKALNEVCAGNEQLANSLLMKIWPWYIRFVCPLLVIVIIVKSIYDKING
ncbi:MAG: sodium-dependent transporter [Lentisphaeria bacterium]